MSATIYDLVWSGNQSTPFLFNPVIDGNVYFCKVYLLNDRAFIEIGTGNNGFLGVQPLVGSCDCGDIQLFPQLGFTDNFVYRESGQHFEVGGVKKSCPEFVPYATQPYAPTPSYTITPDVLEIRNHIDPDFITDTVIFTLETTGVSDGTVVQWRLSGDATSVNFCPYVSNGDLTITSGAATVTLIAAQASYKDPAENAPFTVIVSRDGLDVCESVSVSNWAWYGCGS